MAPITIGKQLTGFMPFSRPKSRTNGTLPVTASGAMMAARTDSSLRVLFNFADFNADGGVDGSDIDAFYAAWDSGQGWADVNGDGGIDEADIAAFMAWWESGGR